MNKKEFDELTHGRIVYLDGAMGSVLQKRGLPKGVCPELWLMDNPKVLEGVLSEYVAAGSDIIYAPTFTATRPKLEEYGIADRLEEINIANVKTALKVAAAADRKVYVAGDISMTGLSVKPVGQTDFEELVDIYKEQIAALQKGGVDLLVVETMMSLQETRAAVIAAKETAPELPIMATLTFNEDKRTLYGTDPTTAAVVLSHLGVSAIGANCSTGPKDMVDIIESMAKACDIPIIAKPNAGIPRLDDAGETVYDNTPDNFAEEIKLLVDAGASLIGGCCGTNPEYIKATCDKKYDIAVRKSENRANLHRLTGERKTVDFTLDDSFVVIGERINPTGKKALQAELREGDISRVLEFAEEQELNGAKILDVNLGMGGVDEKALMIRVIDELQTVTNLPLCIDSSHIDVIEAALRRYPGRALINSISYESAKKDALLKIAAKYGAAFILLPLSDEGLPKSLEEKIDIINKICDEALGMGFTKEDIIVDGLVTTVGANKMAGTETLETIAYCKENGYATTCGLSNISFGLPERGFINAAFLAMAIDKGLTMAIANPNQNLLMNTALACDVLRGKEGADLVYIDRINSLTEAGAFASNVSVSPVKSEKTTGSGNDSAEDALKNAVIKGRKNSVVDCTKACVDKGLAPQNILNDILIVAINEVGDLFESGRFFLPQLINSAETMKLAIEYLEPLLQAGSDDSPKATVVIATVEGDIHDIGKNLVALMLKNYGFRVIDLGKDVPRDVIIDTAMRENASIIALSALMTTTMKEMEEVIKACNSRGCKAKVIIGGAVTTQEYADEIKADGYSKDAADCVKTVKRLLGMLN